MCIILPICRLFLATGGLKNILQGFCLPFVANAVTSAGNKHHIDHIEKGDGYHPLFDNVNVLQTNQMNTITLHTVTLVSNTKLSEVPLCEVLSRVGPVMDPA